MVRAVVVAIKLALIGVAGAVFGTAFVTVGFVLANVPLVGALFDLALMWLLFPWGDLPLQLWSPGDDIGAFYVIAAVNAATQAVMLALTLLVVRRIPRDRYVSG